MTTDPEATLVFTNLALTFMRARTLDGQVGEAIKNEIALHLMQLAQLTNEDRIPAVPPVARFVCELEEAAR